VNRRPLMSLVSRSEFLVPSCQRFSISCDVRSR
jgi:hypothetical protein